MTRTEFTTKIKLAAWQRCKGICEACGLKILGGAEYDHVIPDALGGETTLGNCECVCAKCHRAKTNDDVSRIAKAKRQQANYIGAKSSSSRPIPGSRASGLKKCMNGTVERRVPVVGRIGQ